MHKLVPSFILLLLSSVMAFGQYANTTNVDVTSTKEYKTAKTTFYGGIITASVGAVAWLGGNVVCMIEQNEYTNSHSTTGTVEEIYNLNQEAKQQPAYKTGQRFEIGGFVTMLAGAGIAWFGGSRMKKIKNAAGQTVATIGYAPTENGIVIAMRF
ncbi:MAG: hypothetical protein IJK75_04140 [Bacteroidales bacterium]|nr:hypothetical protein [Bacteroidales bacterium]